GLIKRGSGLAFLGGSFANTYNGATRVIEGELVLIKSAGVTAIPGNLFIDNAASPYNAVSLNAPEQIADTALVHVGMNSWFIPLGYPETIAGFDLSGNGNVDLRGSVVTLTGSVTVPAQANTRITNGKLDLGTEHRLFVVSDSSTLRVSA